MDEKVLQIGICDDKKEDLVRIEKAVRESIERIGIQAEPEFRLFQNGEKLYESGMQENFDLLFLDIEMPGLDGFGLARRICSRKTDVCLIFVSAHESFVFDSQEYMPFWFVRKEMLQRDMFLAMQKYFNLKITKRVSYRDIPIHDMIYIECRGHLLEIHRQDGKTCKQYGSLKAMEEELSKHHFLRIHKSYLVNQEYIEEIGKREIRLSDGTLLEMGRDRRKSLREAMIQYERERYGH